MTAPLLVTPLALLALAAPAPGGGNALLPIVVQFGAIFAIFYFIMIRPQQRQKREHEASLRALKRGDEVVTAGGIVGEVIHIKETVKDGASEPSMEDRITIRSGESRLVVERGRIARIGSRSADASPST